MNEEAHDGMFGWIGSRIYESRCDSLVDRVLKLKIMSDIYVYQTLCVNVPCKQQLNNSMFL